jgi:hypothetical protein
MKLKEIQEGILANYSTVGCADYSSMFDDIYDAIFNLSDEESEELTVKEFLLKVLKTERK